MAKGAAKALEGGPSAYSNGEGRAGTATQETKGNESPISLRRDNSRNLEQSGEKSVEEDDSIPLLFVDVNLGEGKMDRIVLYEGDEPEEVAEEFAQEHSLDRSMCKKLTELLQQQMAGVLSKIEEEGEDDEK